MYEIEEVDSSIDDEYAEQLNDDIAISDEETNVQNSLQDISETLKLLQERMKEFNEVVADFSAIMKSLKTTTYSLESIANVLPTEVHNQCLEEYKKIVNNAVKNYQKFHKSANDYQKSLEENYQKNLTWVTISAIITPTLMLLILLILLFKC